MKKRHHRTLVTYYKYSFHRANNYNYKIIIRNQYMNCMPYTL